MGAAAASITATAEAGAGGCVEGPTHLSAQPALASPWADAPCGCDPAVQAAVFLVHS